MPKRFALFPGWQEKVEYHVCQYRDCRKQALFVMLRRLKPLRDDLEVSYIWLCPDHHWEIEVSREHISVWPNADDRLEDLLSHLIRKEDQP